MKILDVSEFWSERGGGARSHLEAKSRALAALGHEHVIVAPGPVDSDVRTGSLRVVRVRGPSAPYDPTYHLLLGMRRVRSVIQDERPDILECHSPYLALVAVLASACRPRTFFWHADFIDTYGRARLVRGLGERASTAAVSPLWRAWSAALSRFDAVIVTSRTQRDKLEAHGVPRVELVPFGVDRSVFRPGRRAAAGRAALFPGVPAGVPIVVAVGRLASEKRWDVVLDAFLTLRTTHDARLVFLGDGPERAALQRRARGRADVRFAGFVRDRDAFAELLASADVLAHGCPYETFGLSIAEAIACALPVVVPDAAGAGEAAVGDPAALTYRALDANGCARALREMLEREPATLRRDALAAAAEARDEARHFRETIELYAGLAATR